MYLTAAGGMLVRHAAVAQADVPLGLFYGLACLALLTWMQQPERIQYLALSGLGASLTVWTKYEGLSHVAILTAVTGLYVSLNWGRHRFPPALQMIGVYVLPIAAGILPWTAFRQLNGIAVDSEHLNGLHIDRLPTVLGLVGLAMVDMRRWGILWPTLGLAIGFNWRKLPHSDLFYPSLLLGLNLASYVAAYMTTSHEELTAQINDTIHRLLLHIFPLAVFLISLSARTWVKTWPASDATSTPLISENIVVRM